MAWYDYPFTHGYITQNQGPGTDTPHFALDIGTPLDTPITSLFDGIVKVADYKSWGGEVYIQPSKGGPEWYVYHLDQLGQGIISGAKVLAGQVVGLSGGQTYGGSHPTSPQWSTGPHTHTGFFNQFVNGLPYGPDITPTVLADRKNGIGGGGTCTPPAWAYATCVGNIGANYQTCLDASCQLTQDTSTATQAVTGVSGLTDSLTKISASLTSPEWWLRVGIGGTGLLLVIVALVLFVQDSKSGDNNNG